MNLAYGHHTPEQPPGIPLETLAVRSTYVLYVKLPVS